MNHAMEFSPLVLIDGLLGLMCQIFNRFKVIEYLTVLCNIFILIIIHINPIV